MATMGQDAQVESDDSFTVTSLTPSERDELERLTAAAEDQDRAKALAELEDDPDFWKFVEQGRTGHTTEEGQETMALETDSSRHAMETILEQGNKGKELAGPPSYEKRYRELYNQRLQGEISRAEFHRQVDMTLEQIEQETALQEQALDRGDQWLMDYEPTDQDVDRLNEAIRQSRRENEEKDVTEIDHPWHAYLP